MVYQEYLRYMDFFGTKCCFYSDQRLKLYTPLGGIISLISICAMIIIFVLISLSSFKREHPNSITSSILEEEQKLNLTKKKYISLGKYNIIKIILIIRIYYFQQLNIILKIIKMIYYKQKF